MSLLGLALVGLVTASIGLYVEPLLIAHRLKGRSVKRQSNPMLALIPLIGVIRLIPQPYPSDESTRDVRPSRYWIQALVLQIVLALVFAGFAWHFHNHSQIVVACVYSGILFEIALIDFHYRLVLNILSYPAGVLAIGGSLLWPGMGIERAVAGGALGLAIFFIIELFGRGAMGRGDTKLAAVIGLMRGFPGVITALVAGILVGGAVAILLLVTGRSRKAKFAYGPALAVGAILAFFIGKR